jgi:hypothetical protein
MSATIWSGRARRRFRRSLGCKRSLTVFLADLTERFPNLLYAAGVAVLMALLIWGFEWMAGPLAWWMLALLIIPASQAALEITNARSAVAQSTLYSQHGLPECDSRRLQDHGGGSHAAALRSQLREAAQGPGDSLSGESRSQSDSSLCSPILPTPIRRKPTAMEFSTRAQNGIRQLNERYGSRAADHFICCIARAAGIRKNANGWGLSASAAS